MIHELIDGAARAMFVCWWADQCSCGWDYETCRLNGDSMEGWDPTAEHIPNDPGGVELMDIAPETPQSAVDEAKHLLKTVMLDNETWKAVLAREEVQADLEGFGHYLAMEAMGHGVAWSDSHDDHGFKLPLTEYMGIYTDEGSYK